MKKILLVLAILAGISSTASAQFKIGGKTINTKKVINAASDVAHAATLSDADVATMAKEYIEWMDTHNEVAGPATEMGQRLERLTANVKKVAGLDLNFKVYNVIDVNAFACGDGSVRVCGGLMKIMDDDEVFAVIGHEIGHVVNSDSKDAMKNAYLTSAAKNAAGAVDGAVAKLSDSQLGDIAQSLAGAQYSQKKYSLVPTDNSAGNFVKVQQRIPVRIELDDASPEDMQLLRAGMMVETEALRNK